MDTEDIMKAINVLWVVSLILIIVCVGLLVCRYMFGLGLSDFMIRLTGAFALLGVGLLSFTTVKKANGKDSH